MTQQIIGLSGKKGSGKNTSSTVLVEKHGFKEFSLALPLKTLVSKVFDIPMSNLEDPILKETPFDTPITLNHNYLIQIHEQCSWMVNLDMFKKNKSRILEFMITNSVVRADKNAFVDKRLIKSLSNSESSPSFMQGQLNYKSFETPRKLLQFVGSELVRDCISPYFWCVVLDEQIKNEKKVVITDVRFFEEREYIKNKKGTLILIDRESKKSSDSHASENSLGGLGEYNYIIRNDGSIKDLQNRLDVLYSYTSLISEDKIYALPEEK